MLNEDSFYQPIVIFCDTIGQLDDWFLGVYEIINKVVRHVGTEKPHTREECGAKTTNLN